MQNGPGETATYRESLPLANAVQAPFVLFSAILDTLTRKNCVEIEERKRGCAGEPQHLAAKILAIVTLAVLACPAGAQVWDELEFGAHGYVMNDSAHYPLTERWQGPTATSFMTDWQTLVGADTGETADAFYVADLAMGTLDALAATASGWCPGQPACLVPSWLFVAQAQTWVRFKDTLTFQIPAGDYPDGAYAMLSGLAFGWLDAFSDTGGATGAGGGYFANFSTSFTDSVNAVGLIFAYDSSLAHEIFTLTVPLVAEGNVLNQPITVNAHFEAGLGNAYLTAQAHGANIQGLGTSDWTMQFVSLDVPDGVTWTSASGVFLSAESDDTDSDSVPDIVDNCVFLPNADQRDTNGDGFGNVCDPDLDNNCFVNFTDLILLKAVFFTADADADFDGSGIVNFSDLSIMKVLFFGQPGPSGLPNACD